MTRDNLAVFKNMLIRFFLFIYLIFKLKYNEINVFFLVIFLISDILIISLFLNLNSFLNVIINFLNFTQIFIFLCKVKFLMLLVMFCQGW